MTGGAGFIGSHLVDRLMEAGNNEVSSKLTILEDILFYIQDKDHVLKT